MRTTLLLVSALALTGCQTLASIPGIGLGIGPSLQGSVAGATGTGWRVGLIGTSPALELVSSPVVNSGYALVLPGAPGAAAMEQPAENQSIIFSLRAYQDANSNSRYDAGEKLGAAIGSFRYFASNGPAGTYRAGWNQYKGGIYSQPLDTAMNVSAG